MMYRSKKKKKIKRTYTIQCFWVAGLCIGNDVPKIGWEGESEERLALLKLGITASHKHSLSCVHFVTIFLVVCIAVFGVCKLVACKCTVLHCTESHKLTADDGGKLSWVTILPVQCTVCVPHARASSLDKASFLTLGKELVFVSCQDSGCSTSAQSLHSLFLHYVCAITYLSSTRSKFYTQGARFLKLFFITIQLFYFFFFSLHLCVCV